MIFAFLLGLITASVFSGLTYAEDDNAAENTDTNSDKEGDE